MLGSNDYNDPDVFACQEQDRLETQNKLHMIADNHQRQLTWRLRQESCRA